jgi:hypothetical protein
MPNPPSLTRLAVREAISPEGLGAGTIGGDGILIVSGASCDGAPGR